MESSNNAIGVKPPNTLEETGLNWENDGIFPLAKKPVTFDKIVIPPSPTMMIPSRPVSVSQCSSTSQQELLIEETYSYSSDEYSYHEDMGDEDTKYSARIGGKRPISPSAEDGVQSKQSTGMGLETCLQCGAENHLPVQDCSVASDWIRKRQQLPTFPGVSTVQFVMDSIVAEVGQQTHDPMDLCEQYGWDVIRLRQLRENAAPGEELVGANDVDRLQEADLEFDHPGNIGPVQVEPADPRPDNAHPAAALDVIDDARVEEIPAVVERFLQPVVQRIDQFLPASYTCRICLEENLGGGQVFSLACDEIFCRDCWHGYLEQALQVTPTAPTGIQCPQTGCAMQIRESTVQHVAPDLLPLYQSRRLDSFVSLQLGLRWCPGPDCDRVAFLPGNLFEDQLDRSCFSCDACNTSFCFGCGNDPHEGACQLVEEAPVEIPEHNAHEANPLFTTRDDRRRKQCPHCHIMIEKTGGCNRMTCRCGHAFCWLCLGNYSDYGAHQCSAFNPNPNPAPANAVNLEFLRTAMSNRQGIQWSHQLEAVNDKIVELGRYAFYYNRYFAHELGQHFAEGLCPCLQHRANAYLSVNALRGGTDCDFFVLANETLVMSRRLLKYAYCSAYHSQRTNEDDAANSHLGFLSLSRLERFTEELSEVSENALTRHDRTRILNLVAAVKQTMGAVEDFEDFETLHRNR